MAYSLPFPSLFLVAISDQRSGEATEQSNYLTGPSRFLVGNEGNERNELSVASRWQDEKRAADTSRCALEYAGDRG